MFEFLETIALENEERLSDERADKIKSSVLSRIEEEKPMKKNFSVKPFIVAAAIMAAGAVSAVSAGAAVNTNVSDITTPGAATKQPAASEVQETSAQNITPAESAEKSAEKAKVVKQIEEAEGEIAEINGQLTNMIEENNSDMKFIGGSIVGSENTVEMAPEGLVHFEGKDDPEFIREDSDGTKYYKTRDGEVISVRPVTEENSSYYLYFKF